MSLYEFLLKLNGKFPFLGNFSRNWVKRAVLNPRSRLKLNKFYHKLNFYEKSIFHALYSRVFRDGKTYEINGEWILKFAGKEIRMPLESKTLWLDWETALSILGHDYEIKSFYQNQINSKKPPKCFLDIGANFGTHSLMFLAAGIEAISIEPNPECKLYFERMIAYNGLKGNWNAIGLGKEKGNAELVFPEGETWLGSFNQKIKDSLNAFKKLKSYNVEIRTLDEFINSTRIYPDIIKIDTEGYEENILFGGKDFFKLGKAVAIFEANSEIELKKIGLIFNEWGYSIFGLKSSLKVDFNAMVDLKEVNFIAKITEKNNVNKTSSI